MNKLQTFLSSTFLLHKATQKIVNIPIALVTLSYVIYILALKLHTKTLPLSSHESLNLILFDLPV